MLDEAAPLPEAPEELRVFTARLLAEVKAQAILIEKLRHQLAGHRAHRFGASSETAEQLQLALETSEIAAAAMIARLRLPDVEEKGQPKRRPIPDHVPRMEVELSPATEACVGCGGKLSRIGEDVTEELPAHLPRIERVIEPASTLCPCGCGEMTRIGEDVSERLDGVPAQLRMLVTRRPKYACRPWWLARASASSLLTTWTLTFGNVLPSAAPRCSAVAMRREHHRVRAVGDQGLPDATAALVLDRAARSAQRPVRRSTAAARPRR